MLWHAAAASLLAAAMGFAGGWKVRDWKAGADAAAALEQANRDAFRRVERAATASKGYEGRRAARDEAARQRDKEADHVAQDPVLSRECLSDDSLRILADEIQARQPAAGQPRPAVPAASAAHQQGR